MMNETPGNSFDTTTVEGRLAEMQTLLEVKYNTEEHQQKFLDGYWAGLEGQTPRELVQESEGGFNHIKDLLRCLKPGMYPAKYVEADELRPE